MNVALSSTEMPLTDWFVMFIAWEFQYSFYYHRSAFLLHYTSISHIHTHLHTRSELMYICYTSNFLPAEISFIMCTSFCICARTPEITTHRKCINRYINRWTYHNQTFLGDVGIQEKFIDCKSDVIILFYLDVWIWGKISAKC